MNNLSITAIQVGPIQTNCYIVANEDTKKALVFDPGEDANKIYNYINQCHLTVEAILLTHGHFDHITGVSDLVRLTNAKVYMLEAEKDLAMDDRMNCSAMFGQRVTLFPDILIKNQEELSFLDTKIKVIATPGHTKGSVCYFFEENKILISGDTLFLESYGRTDFPTGSDFALERSLTMLLTTLPQDVVVYPGHGPKTTIGYEQKNNPYGSGV
ncbi:MAG: MBL fold metallo-hydrolase [Clostridiales bacterium]|nr:MBL fold metallo-hydrolase [Clostridiales bacterium]